MKSITRVFLCHQKEIHNIPPLLVRETCICRFIGNNKFEYLQFECFLAWTLNMTVALTSFHTEQRSSDLILCRSLITRVTLLIPKEN